MRVFDSDSGRELVEGSVFTNEMGERTVIRINPQLLRPTIILLQHETQHTVVLPLLVRWLRPGHLFERVAYIREMQIPKD